MKLHIRTFIAKKNINYLLGALVLLVLILGYPCRGFIRNTVFPLAATALYMPGLSRTTNVASSEVQDIYPFGHITYISDTASCSLADADHLKTGIYCSRYLFRGQASIKDTSVDSFENKAHAFEKALKAHGWTSNINYGGVNRSYGPPYHWWYIASYIKTTGKVSCSVTVQRDNDPHLLDTEMICYRRVVFF
ncbi:MAG TPA: hypothetical protein VLF62_03400 [Candidatus Saccharimonadales bacterium]|nr:hypothetical protein [Candidatus Saccharimonadales bacterium]